MADYNGRTFEFVSKSEIKIVKSEIDSLIRKLQSVLRTEGITFQSALVGSAGRSLVTKQIGGNTKIHKCFQSGEYINRISTKMEIDFDDVVSSSERIVRFEYNKSNKGAIKS